MIIYTLIFLVADTLAMLCWARLLLQRAQLPYQHPLAQFCLSSTNWLIVPLRKLIPPFRQWDSACILAPLLLYYLACCLNLFILLPDWPLNISAWLLNIAYSILFSLKSLCYVLIIGLMILMILSFNPTYSPLKLALQRLFLPIMRPLAFMRYGRYDFSATVLVILLWLCATVLIPTLLHKLNLSLLIG